tara:strand:- start:6182 stop:7390 length:1209 start_codon:yes stop_codon:yes gene_type:complete
MKKVKLERSLGLFHTTIAGVGIILGAGIYALIGAGAGLAGNALWLSFLLASIIAMFTGLSYAELSSIFKKDSGEFKYADASLGRKIAYFTGLMLFFEGVISAAAVAIGFGGYLGGLVGLPLLVSALGLIIVMTVVNYIGIKESAFLNILFTVIEVIGLFIIIFLGIKYFGSVDYLDMPNGFNGVLQATALVFFAFIGFEAIIKLAEETKNPKKIVPKAVILSLLFSSVIYVLVAVAAVSIMPWNELAISGSPLADVAALSFGALAFLVISVIALFSTGNTVLMIMVTTSRLVYGIAAENKIFKWLSNVDKKTQTPLMAILLVCLITIIFAIIGDLTIVASLANLSIFVVFGIVNVSAIVLRYKKPGKRGFKMPLNIGKFPVISLLGLLTSLFMIFFVFKTLL